MVEGPAVAVSTYHSQGLVGHDCTAVIRSRLRHPLTGLLAVEMGLSVVVLTVVVIASPEHVPMSRSGR